MNKYPSHFESIIKKANPKSLYLLDLGNYIPSDHWSHFHPRYGWDLNILHTIKEFKAQTLTYINNSFISQYDENVHTLEEHEKQVFISQDDDEESAYLKTEDFYRLDQDKVTIKNFEETFLYHKYRPREIVVKLFFLSGYLTRLYIYETIWDKTLHYEAINDIVMKENTKFKPPNYIANSSNEITDKSYIYKDLHGANILGGFYRKPFGRLESKFSLNYKLIQISDNFYL